MLWSKVRCAECEHYNECPMDTRLFVNYCGSRAVTVAARVKAALSDCRARRAFFMRQRRTGLLSTPPVAGTQARPPA
jgi:hypothetical protein